MLSVRDALYAGSPYADFEPALHPPDLQGWGSDHGIFRALIEQVRPERILEVGSWKGRSAINMARAVRDLGLATEIVCVDTWLGSPEHWLAGQPAHWLHNEAPDMYTSLRIRNGMPRLFETFRANVIQAGMQDVITPFPISSDNAARVFAELGIGFDLIYLDGAHEYDAVSLDLARFWPLVKVGGVLFGDDYGGWPGVTSAVDDFVRDLGTQAAIDLDKYAIVKTTAAAPPSNPPDLRKLQEQLVAAEQALRLKTEELDQFRRAIYQSTSWRVTGLLRRIRSGARR